MADAWIEIPTALINVNNRTNRKKQQEKNEKRNGNGTINQNRL